MTQTSTEFEREVLRGLASPRKALPCKYFYDDRGSALFSAICETPEYYVTRTEIAILRKACPQVASHVGPFADILEPGAGVGEKVQILLDALPSPRSFVPIDISESALASCAQAIREQYPNVEVVPVLADFTKEFELPSSFSASTAHRKLIFFPGSTISNFSPLGAQEFLRGLRHVLSKGDFMLIGVDRQKDRATLEKAYNDEQGLTADFNRNLLVRMKSELDTDLDVDSFAHRAIYNETESRIEMYLVSRVRQQVKVGGVVFEFQEGEAIHTENSYKYSVEAFAKVAENAAFQVQEVFSDSDELFSVYLCRAV